MVVTAVIAKTKGRSAVFGDNIPLAWISDEVLLEEGIRIGSEVTEEDIARMKRLTEARLAKEKALNLLSYRAHSQKELSDKLLRTCGEEDAENAVRRMEELGLVNDESFAKAYAESMTRRKTYSARRVEQELLRKGIGRESAAAAVAEFCGNDEEKIMALLASRYAGKLAGREDSRKVIASLQRMGFQWEDIRRAMQEYTEEWNED